MKRASVPGAAAPALLALALLAACSDSPMPGRVLGMYKVTAQSKTNTCGLGAPDPWTFSVQLSLDGSTLYWSWLDGTALRSGTLSSGAASLKTSSSANADSTDAGLGPCTLQRDEDLEITLPSGSSPPSFSGSIAYGFTPASGAQCGDQLTSGGGQYTQLPCTLTYTVSATRQ